MRKEFLFVEKYRPQTIEDTILPADIKQTFLEFVKQGEKSGEESGEESGDKTDAR